MTRIYVYDDDAERLDKLCDKYNVCVEELIEVILNAAEEDGSFIDENI